MPNLADILRQLSSKQTGSSAQDNTDLLTQWAKLGKLPNLIQNTQEAPSENYQRAQAGAQDFASYFNAKMSDKQKDQIQKALEEQLKQQYPQGAADQSETTGQGRQFWDLLRALAAARWRK